MAFAAAASQFLLEGLAPLMLMALRREPLSSYGLTSRNLWRSLVLGLALAVLYNLALSWHAGTLLWIPLRRQPAVRMSLAARFPLELVGLVIAVLIWGFLEGCFGVYFARKVNLALSHNGCGWFAPGRLAFALFNGVIHRIVAKNSPASFPVLPRVTRSRWFQRSQEMRGVAL